MELKDIIQPQNRVYKKPALLNDNNMHYCPGCSHGVVHKLVAEIIEDMGATEYAVGISPVGCAVFAYNYIDIDWLEAAHGRREATDARQTGVHLSRRRRLFRYRHMRVDSFVQPWRKHCHYLYQQCHLRYDWRTDGSYHTSRSENGNLSLRPPCGPEWLSVVNHSTFGTTRRHLLCDTPERSHPSSGAQG